MFLFFNSRMGCLGSLMMSLVVTFVLIALLGGLDGCGTTTGGGGAPDGGGGGGDF
ncbi:MAG TPA: hypothetical protein VIL49_12495 [Capillimicrobium sp.]|jgi:hypothetical protein